MLESDNHVVYNAHKGNRREAEQKGEESKSSKSSESIFANDYMMSMGSMNSCMCITAAEICRTYLQQQII